MIHELQISLLNTDGDTNANVLSFDIIYPFLYFDFPKFLI
jgi:hypothetical protein